jgi:hypothetical protein
VRGKTSCKLRSVARKWLPQLAPSVTSVGVNDARQMAPKVEVGRGENGRSRRPHNWSVSSYPSAGVVAVYIEYDDKKN